MRATRSGIVIGLALAMLVPGSVVGQEASPPAEPLTEDPARTLALSDSSGDLTDITTGEATDGPGYTDITGLEVSVESGVLTVRFDVADDVPEAPDPMSTTNLYYLMIDTDADGFQNRHVVIRSEDGWNADVYDWDATQVAPIGDAVVVDGSLAASVPVTELGLTPEARFHGLMQAMDTPDPVGDPLDVIEWQDRVPDREGRWLMLRDATPTERPQDELSDAERLWQDILGQKPKDLRSISRKQMLRAVDALWEKHGDHLTDIPPQQGNPVSRKAWRQRAARVFKGRVELQEEAAILFIAFNAHLYGLVDDEATRRALADLADMSFERTEAIDQPGFNAKRGRAYVDGKVRSLLDFLACDCEESDLSCYCG